MHFSVRMRAAQGGAHENGGRHISGAERLIPRELLLETTQAMVQRALEHSRGNADFIRLTVEAVAPTVTPSGEVAAFPAAYVTIPHTVTPKRGDRVTVTAGTPAIPGPLWVEAVEAGIGTATRFQCRTIR